MDLNKPYTKLSENLFVLHEKMFPLYLITGKENFLIDTSISALQENIYKKIKSLLSDRPLEHILLTHSHYDHTGALPFLQEKFNISISSSKRTIELLQKEDVRAFIGDMNTRFNNVLGISEKVEFPALKKLHILKEGDRIDIDENRYFEVIASPGHTRCSLSFLLMPDRVLFPRDAAGVLEKNKKIKPLFLSDYSSYVLSLRKLIKIEAEMLCPPHNNYIKGKEKVRDHLMQALESAIDLKDKIIRSLESGAGIEDVSKNILEKEFPLPVVEGPKKAFNINLNSMVRAVEKLTKPLKIFIWMFFVAFLK